MLLKINDSENSCQSGRLAKAENVRLAMRICLRGWGTFPRVASIVFFAYSTCLQPCLLAQAEATAPGNRQLAAQIPFVGCKSDGQLGPMKAPHGKARVLPIAKEPASRLAYYKAEEGPGVLAPRGWHCFGTYGSSGYTLYVSPHTIDAATIFSPDWKGFTGPAIELTRVFGGTSGRFGVAEVIARVFPAHHAFVRKVIKEGLEPPSAFPFSPYPKDMLHYKNSEIVEYETPGGADGLGTSLLGLQKNSDPISGVAILVGQTPDLLHLSARLPPNLTGLTPPIIQQIERDAARKHL